MEFDQLRWDQEQRAQLLIPYLLALEGLKELHRKQAWEEVARLRTEVYNLNYYGKKNRINAEIETFQTALAILQSIFEKQPCNVTNEPCDCYLKEFEKRIKGRINDLEKQNG